MLLKWLLIAFVLVAAPAAADIVEIKNRGDAPSCIEAPLCMVGYQGNGTVEPGDDTAYLWTGIEGVTVRPGVGPDHTIGADYENTSFPNPVFPVFEELWMDLNGSLPAELQGALELRSGTDTMGNEGNWLHIAPYTLVPIQDPERHHSSMVVQYFDHWLERDTIYPFMQGGTMPGVGTDDFLDLGVMFTTTCLPEETRFAPEACALRTPPAAWSFDRAMEALPNVHIRDGFGGAAVELGDARPASSPPGGASESVLVGIAEGASEGGSASPASEDSASFALVTDEALLTSGLPASASSRGDLGPVTAQALGYPSTDASPLLALASGAAFLALAVALYRRLQRQRLLDQPNRKAIVDIVGAEPGINIAQVAQRLGLSYKTAQHHVDILVEDSFVLVQPYGSHRNLFPAQGRFAPGQRQQVVLARRRESLLRFAQLLAAEGAMRRNDLMQRSNVSRTAAWKSLKTMAEQGWIEPLDGSRNPVVRPTPLLGACPGIAPPQQEQAPAPA